MPAPGEHKTVRARVAAQPGNALLQKRQRSFRAALIFAYLYATLFMFVGLLMLALLSVHDPEPMEKDWRVPQMAASFGFTLLLIVAAIHGCANRLVKAVRAHYQGVAAEAEEKTS